MPPNNNQLEQDFLKFIEAARSASGIRERGWRARQWYKTNIKKLFDTLTPNDRQNILGNTNITQPKNVITPGKMYMYFYNPKHRKTLPYYDRFPLIFMVEPTKDGFYGLNLHYLPIRLRVRLYKVLMQLANNNNYDDKTKLKISYKILKSMRRYKLAAPCFKRYLTSHVRSRLREIPANQWEMTLFLPVERFEKASKQRVWNESKKKGKKGF